MNRAICMFKRGLDEVRDNSFCRPQQNKKKDVF